MEDVEVPEFFICPISLQIMKDPVIAITGITYDRSSIEKWLNYHAICPVSKQPLPRNSILTPNHILSKLIHTWQNSTSQTIQYCHAVSDPNDHAINKSYIISLISNLSYPNSQLTNLEVLVAVMGNENKIYRQILLEAGVFEAMVSFVITCHKSNKTSGLEQALHILFVMIYKIFPGKSKELVLLLSKNDEFMIDTFIWVLGFRSCDHDINTKAMKNHAMILLKIFLENTNSNMQERFKSDFFKTIVNFLSQDIVTQHGMKAALHIMLGACSSGLNCLMMVEAGAIFAIIELELAGLIKDIRLSELSLQVLFKLCTSADGRAHFLSHAAAIAVVTRKIMSVSPATDEAAVSIILLISKYSGKDWVVNEMLRVGTVSRLCMVLQSNCDSCLKEKAREILRRHTRVMKDSPCVDVLLLTRYTK